VATGAAQVARARTGLTGTLDESFGSSLVRTFCPGPLDTDVFGSNDPTVASASIGLAQLLRRHSVVSLSHPGSFNGFGYVGTRSGAIRFSMTLERVRARLVPTTVRGRAAS
jgi:hypothetical protein